MMFKKKGKIVSCILIFMLTCIFCTACSVGEPPKMKITSGKTEIKYLITKETWNGEERKNVNPFQVYAKKNEKLVSVKSGESITMEFEKFEGEAPEIVELQIFALNKDGSFVDENADPVKVDVELKGQKVTFEVPEDLSEAKAYGYDLRCIWGSDICRYNFMVK